MSKLSRKRIRKPGPVTSTQIPSVTEPTNKIYLPKQSDEEIFRKQLEDEIAKSKRTRENFGKRFDY